MIEAHALEVGKAHQAVLKAAFTCDRTRVVTFQWSPGTNHVSFGGLYPGDSNAIMMHHPVSHRIGGGTFGGSDPVPTNADLEFLCRVELWYNQRIAEFLTELSQTNDIYGGNILDQTIVPCVTEVENALHGHGNVPTALFGGKNLGFKVGQFVAANRPHNDMWLTVAAALGVPLDQLQGEAILRGNYSGIIDQIWAPPAA
jgi:hypothetical protein